MEHKELIKKVRRIQIRTSHMVNDVLAGEYHSVFKGQGMEFDEVREYQVGDDVRSIDWNVTARYGKPFIKKFVEERELTVMLLVDASGSSDFGSFKQFKRELAAEIAALLAFSAIKNNDKVGAIIFTDQIERFISPKKGKKHVLCVIREILNFRPKNTATSIDTALQFFVTVMKRKSVSFLISDFIDDGFDRALRLTNQRHDLIAVSLDDPRQYDMPDMGIVEFVDSESGENYLVDFGSKLVREKYKKEMESVKLYRQSLLKSCNVDEINIISNESYIEAIMKFFKMRERKL